MPVLVWLVLALPLVAAVGGKGAVWFEKRYPAAYTRSPEYLAGLREPSLVEWRRMSTVERAAYDGAVLEVADDRPDSGQRAAEALLKRHAAFRP
ncbi:hypothetical protein [Streptomyces kaempferi]|uniref:Uncharacterized protein n=1 Tax=Streptomyces kaempferi TaxID=333725 RepID=A0ABW3XIC5_9ACTN